MAKLSGSRLRGLCPRLTLVSPGNAELQAEQMRLKRKAAGGSGRKYKFVSEVNEQGFIEGAPSILCCLEPGSLLLDCSHISHLLYLADSRLHFFCQDQNVSFALHHVLC